MIGLLIAVFTGWFGGYRFYRKQKGLGVLYLCTFGLFGIGWFVDIIAAYKAMRTSAPTLKKNFTMQIEIRGAFAKCKKNPNIKRYSVIEGLSLGTELGVEISTYDGAPFYQLLAPDGLDIGAFPSEISRMILRNYPNAKVSATLTDKTDSKHPYAVITVK